MDIAREAANEPVAPAPESALKGAGVDDRGGRFRRGPAPRHPDPDRGGGRRSRNPTTRTRRRPRRASTRTATAPTWPASWSATAASPAAACRACAPEASLISVRVLDDLGRGADLGRAGRAPVDPGPQGPSTASAWSTSPSGTRCSSRPRTTRWWKRWTRSGTRASWWSAPPATAAATGTSPSPAPATRRKVITVGATNDRDTRTITDDKIATYSSRGPTAFDLVAKPDLVAPGNRIVSLRSPRLASWTCSCPTAAWPPIPQNPAVQDYFEMSGTSMASPMVAAHRGPDDRAGPVAEPGHGQGAADDVGAEGRVRRPDGHAAPDTSTSWARCAPTWIGRGRAVAARRRRRPTRARSRSRTPPCCGATRPSRCARCGRTRVVWSDPDGLLDADPVDRRRDVAPRRRRAATASCGRTARSGPRARCGRTARSGRRPSPTPRRAGPC